MAISVQELSDRAEIQDLLFHYADIIDRCAAEELRPLFTEDAQIDYSAFGGSVGDVDTTIAFLKEAMPAFSNTQHLNGNIQIKVQGDSAEGRVMCFNPMEMQIDDKPQVFMLGLWYVDSYRRVDGDWRIASRREVKSWVFNTPEFMAL